MADSNSATLEAVDFEDPYFSGLDPLVKAIGQKFLVHDNDYFLYIRCDRFVPMFIGRFPNKLRFYEQCRAMARLLHGIANTAVEEGMTGQLEPLFSGALFNRIFDTDSGDQEHASPRN